MMVKITGNGFEALKKHLDKRVADFAKKLKNDKINELKRKGLYKPGITKVEVIINDSKIKRESGSIFLPKSTNPLTPKSLRLKRYL